MTHTLRRTLGPSLILAAFAVIAGVFSPGSADALGSFWDDDGNPHETNIEAIAAAGITKGCGNGSYCPESSVTRAQMATFIVRALGLSGGTSSGFSDIGSHPHRQDIEQLAVLSRRSRLACGNGQLPDASPRPPRRQRRHLHR